MALEISEIFRALLAIIFVIAFTLGYNYLIGGETIFWADAPHDAVFHVDLRKDKNYELWVLDSNGPEMAKVSIRNGSYIPYEDTFRLMHPEGDYLPYHPVFSVNVTGRYDINVHPLDPGTIRIKVKQDTGLNPYRIIRDIRNRTG